MPESQISLSKLLFSWALDTFNLLSTEHLYSNVQSVLLAPNSHSYAGKPTLKETQSILVAFFANFCSFCLKVIHHFLPAEGKSLCSQHQRHTHTSYCRWRVSYEYLSHYIMFVPLFILYHTSYIILISFYYVCLFICIVPPAEYELLEIRIYNLFIICGSIAPGTL